jgi:peptidoglycan hydrolase-like protein with peptidoglycan-binding domain
MRPIVGLTMAASLLLCGFAWAVEGLAAPSTPSAGLSDQLDGGEAAAIVPIRPVKSDDVAEVQRRLKALGYPVGAVDGRLGRATRKAINAFLSDRGLPPSDWIGPDLITELEGAIPAAPRSDASRTDAAPHIDPSKSPAVGIMHDSLRGTDPDKVRIVQRRLGELGFYAGPQDGVVAPALTEAIKAYQASVGMPATGWIFPDLVAELSAPPKSQAVVAEEAPQSPPPQKTWMPRDLLGKKVHDLPGDLLGAVSEIVIGGDGIVAGVVAAVTDSYGDSRGEALIPWSQVAPSVGRPVIVLPLSAQQASPLRRQQPEFQLAAGQMLVSRLIGAKVRVEGARWGTVNDAVFFQAGPLDHLMIRGGVDSVERDVPAADVSLNPDQNAVDLRQVPLERRFESGAS